LSDAHEAVKARVLVIEDEEILRDLLVTILEEDKYLVDSVESGEKGLKALERELYDLVLLDLNLPGMHGLNVLAAAPALQTDAQFIVMTAFGSVDTAVEAMKLGAFDYINKPFRTEELLLTLQRAHRETELRREVASLRRRAGDSLRSKIIGRSPTVNRMFDLIERVAPTRATALVIGETGTGKELVARAIHDLSDRARKSFVAINCSALPETLLESELFGHMKGSFTGAIANKRGLFEEASGGTLFLDEISTIAQATQVKLLRVLQDRKLQRIGGGMPVAVDFRLIAATNMDLGEEVRSGRFREDLYYRLNVFPIRVPPLRERGGDIALLANYFRMRFAQENGIEPPAISPETMSRLMSYAWPGNVRELENFIERAVIMYAGARSIPFEPPLAEKSRSERELLERARDERWNIERLEREYILDVLESVHGHRGHAAEILGIDRRTLYRKLKEYQAAGLAPANMDLSLVEV
jgi:DNA-binding NtrC family response regulator